MKCDLVMKYLHVGRVRILVHGSNLAVSEQYKYQVLLGQIKFPSAIKFAKSPHTIYKGSRGSTGRFWAAKTADPESAGRNTPLDRMDMSSTAAPMLIVYSARWPPFTALASLSTACEMHAAGWYWQKRHPTPYLAANVVRGHHQLNCAGNVDAIMLRTSVPLSAVGRLEMHLAGTSLASPHYSLTKFNGHVLQAAILQIYCQTRKFNITSILTTLNQVGTLKYTFEVMRTSLSSLYRWNACCGP